VVAGRQAHRLPGPDRSDAADRSRDGQDTKPLAPSTFFPGRASFSPNGKTVAIATIKPYTKRFREGTSSMLMVDLASGKTQFFAPAPYESVTTRTEDGPIYAPNGKEMAFVMDDLLYVMPVDAAGIPAARRSR
jgi:Tol biopolymer transport system component